MKSRRITFLIYSLGAGGAERVTLSLAEQWAKDGHEVTVLIMTQSAQSVYRLPDSVRLVPLDLANQSHTIWQALAINFRRLMALRRFWSHERPDIVIGMMTTSAVLLALTRRHDMIAIGSERVDPHRSPVGRMWFQLRRLFYRRLDCVVALTDENRMWLLEHTNARKVVVIPNPLRLPLPKNPPDIAVSQIVRQGQQVMLGVGRLHTQKAWPLLLKAFSSLTLRFPEWQLVILGEGPDRKALESQIAKLGLEKSVTLPGWAGNLAEWYERADLFAMTSEYEGFPNALAEAQAHGCPAVSVNCGSGPGEIIRHEKTGLIVPQHNHDALVEALASLMSDPQRRAEMSLNAKKIIEELAPARVDALWQEVLDPTSHHLPQDRD